MVKFKSKNLSPPVCIVILQICSLLFGIIPETVVLVRAAAGSSNYTRGSRGQLTFQLSRGGGVIIVRRGGKKGIK